MGTLILNSLEIKNFRGFRHLQIEHLGRVNLIVGKNNVGKSTLLEALLLYARKASPMLIWELLGMHDERRVSTSLRHVGIEDMLSALKYLFYGRKDVKASLEPIQIGPINSPDHTFSITLNWYTTQIDESGNPRTRPLQPEEYNTVENLIPRFVIQTGSQPRVHYSLNFDALNLPRLFRSELKEPTCVFITASGLNVRQLGELWDSITLTGLEKEVFDALRIIAPGVEGLSFIDDHTSTRERFPIVKIEGIDEPIPLRSLGDGMQRMLGVTLALVNARGGILLIDEIENGLHYSVQPDLWYLIFRLARRLNVQVFAATHSWDCLEAFQKAAKENEQEEGVLIRLSSRKGEIGVTLFDEEELGVATREQIEVR
jgi:hypothetical protein